MSAGSSTVEPLPLLMKSASGFISLKCSSPSMWVVSSLPGACIETMSERSKSSSRFTGSTPCSDMISSST